MTSNTTIVKHRVRTTGLEHQGKNSISDLGQNLGFICIFSSVMHENIFCSVSSGAKLFAYVLKTGHHAKMVLVSIIHVSFKNVVSLFCKGSG